MTIDKFKHYLGEQVFNHINSLNIEQLNEMRRNLSDDIKAIQHDSETLFKRNIELNYINYLLL